MEYKADAIPTLRSKKTKGTSASRTLKLANFFELGVKVKESTIPVKYM